MENKKILDLNKCDVIKVFMMLCVMFYHCICLWNGGEWFNQPPAEESKILEVLCAFLNTFHIYVFAFVSGYLFHFLRFEKQRYVSFLKDVGHRAKRLLLPYVIVSLVWAIPFSIYFFKKDFVDILKDFGLAMAPNQLWFLVMLFVVFVVFYVMSNFFEKHNALVGFIVAVAIYCIATVASLVLPNVFQIFTAFKYLFYYFLGFSFGKYKDNILYRNPWFVYCFIQLALFALHFFVTNGREETLFKLINIAIYPVICTFGVLSVIIGLSKFNYEHLRNSRIFVLLSKHNFVMYMLHQQLIYITISIFNSKVNTPILVLINFAFSFLVSFIISIGISKIPYIKKAFGYK